MPENLAELEVQLRELSHDSKALELIQKFAKQLGKTKSRQIVFSAPGALIRKPIFYENVLERGLISDSEAPFFLLQVDKS